MNLVIDIGNTQVKAAVFSEGILLEKAVFSVSSLVSEVKNLHKKHLIHQTIIANVAHISEKKFEKLEQIGPIIKVSGALDLPFKNNYTTPLTLGADRIALIAAAVKKYPNKNVLVIGAGTCLTFDFVDATATYFGGAISPGIAMRFKALHQFTGKLPLIEKKIVRDFIGSNTEESIISGVVNGVVQEIEGVIGQYKEKYQVFKIVLTGGDTNFLSKQLKSIIFANQNFLLEGLHELLIFNNHK